MLISCLFFGLVACADQQTRTEHSYRDATALEKSEMCQKVGCQYNVKVVLKQQDGSIFDKTFEALPVTQSDGFMVVAGQSVSIEADVDEDELTNFRLVQSITDPGRTITAKFEQQPDGSMILYVANPFSRHFRSHMMIMPLDKEDLFPTSSCPVVAKGGSFEMWPYPIFQVWLGSPRFLEDGAEMSCVE